MKDQISAKKSLTALSMLLAIALASCASSLNQPSSSKVAAPADLATMSEQAQAPNAPAKAVVSRPQLIKSAEISLQVKSIEESSKAISDLVKQQQGDILELQDFRFGNSDIAQSVSLKIRIPQERLDLIIDAIAQYWLIPLAIYLFLRRRHRQLVQAPKPKSEVNSD